MKKKLVSSLLCLTMLAGCLTGCGGGGNEAGGTNGGTEASGTADEAGDEESTEVQGVSSSAGDENGTKLELWTFVDAHAEFYLKMVESWNEQNPDETIYLTATTYPYGDMHNKYLMSLQADTGAPDICDEEVGQFPNVVAYEDSQLYALDDAAAPYMETMVQARMDTYAGANGKHYGAPFHVGATVMYYNVDLISQALGCSYDEAIAKIDAVKTWEDYEALGKEYVDAKGEEGKYWTSVDTGGTDWLWLAMAEYGDDWTGGFDGEPNVQLESVSSMLKMQQSWLNDNLAQVSPDGHVDLEAGYQNILDGNIVSFPKAMWYMSRFKNYMDGEEDSQKGKWYIAKCPVFKEGQDCSVGIGGTGTVVSKQSAAPELAAKFICWAKMSEEGEAYIWNELGFDVCNTAYWTDPAFAQDENNYYNTFFLNKPYDVLADIAGQIGKISVVPASPTINEQLCTITLNAVLEEGQDVDEALQEAQDEIMLNVE